MRYINIYTNIKSLLLYIDFLTVPFCLYISNSLALKLAAKWEYLVHLTQRHRNAKLNKSLSFVCVSFVVGQLSTLRFPPPICCKCSIH